MSHERLPALQSRNEFGRVLDFVDYQGRREVGKKQIRIASGVGYIDRGVERHDFPVLEYVPDERTLSDLARAGNDHDWKVLREFCKARTERPLSVSHIT